VFLVAACDVAETKVASIELEIARVRGEYGAIELGVLLSADVELVFGGDRRLVADPVRAACGLAVAGSTSYSPVPIVQIPAEQFAQS